MAGGFVPGRVAKARLETDVRSELVTLHAGFQVLPDFLLACEHAGPIGIPFKRKRIEMSWHVASAAGITVFVPGAAEVVALLDNQKIFHSGFEQLDAHADAGKSRADDKHVDRNVPRGVMVAGGFRHVDLILYHYHLNSPRQHDCTGIQSFLAR